MNAHAVGGDRPARGLAPHHAARPSAQHLLQGVGIGIGKHPAQRRHPTGRPNARPWGRTIPQRAQLLELAPIVWERQTGGAICKIRQRDPGHPRHGAHRKAPNQQKVTSSAAKTIRQSPRNSFVHFCASCGVCRSRQSARHVHSLRSTGFAKGSGKLPCLPATGATHLLPHLGFRLGAVVARKSLRTKAHPKPGLAGVQRRRR